MAVTTYPKRRLPQYDNNVRCKTKRQRKDANIASGELLSLRGGSAPSSPLFTEEAPSSPRGLPTDNEEDRDDDQYVGFVQNHNLILALYLAAGLEIPEGMSPPQDRSMIRHGIKAWELMRQFLPDSVLDGVVKPVLLVPDDAKAVPSMNTILQRVADMCMRNGKPIFPWDEDIDDDHDTYALRVDCSELMNYLMSILVWMVSNSELLYYRLGFERVYWRVKLYMFIWRSFTIEHLKARGNRPWRERESLYGENAKKYLDGEMAGARKNIQNITALQAQFRDDGKADLPRRASSLSVSSGQRDGSSPETAFKDPNGNDEKQDKKRKGRTPSKKKRPGDDRKFGSGTKLIRSPYVKAYDPFGKFDLWQANVKPARVLPDDNIRKNEWKQFLRDERAARRAEEEKRVEDEKKTGKGSTTPNTRKWEVYDPSQVDNLDQRTTGKVKRFGRPEREFWPAPVQYRDRAGRIRYEV